MNSCLECTDSDKNALYSMIVYVDTLYPGPYMFTQKLWIYNNKMLIL